MTDIQLKSPDQRGQARRNLLTGLAIVLLLLGLPLAVWLDFYLDPSLVDARRAEHIRTLLQNALKTLERTR